MLRSLDPENNYRPKSKKFEPTEEEAKKFSQDELDSIQHMKDADEEWRITHAVRDAERRALLRMAGLDQPEASPAPKLSRRP